MLLYVIHPFRGDGTTEARALNTERIRQTCIGLLALGHTPVSPVHCFSYLDDEDPIHRARSLEACLELLNLCHEAWVFGDAEHSEGCQREIAEAYQLQHPVRVLTDDLTLITQEPYARPD